MQYLIILVLTAWSIYLGYQYKKVISLRAINQLWEKNAFSFHENLEKEAEFLDTYAEYLSRAAKSLGKDPNDIFDYITTDKSLEEPPVQIQ